MQEFYPFAPPGIHKCPTDSSDLDNELIEAHAKPSGLYSASPIIEFDDMPDMPNIEPLQFVPDVPNFDTEFIKEIVSSDKEVPLAAKFDHDALAQDNFHHDPDMPDTQTNTSLGSLFLTFQTLTPSSSRGLIPRRTMTPMMTVLKLSMRKNMEVVVLI